jgi:hypothetical protein
MIITTIIMIMILITIIILITIMILLIDNNSNGGNCNNSDNINNDKNSNCYNNNGDNSLFEVIFILRYWINWEFSFIIGFVSLFISLSWSKKISQYWVVVWFCNYIFLLSYS